jgi:hypothetical protein
MGSTTFTSYQNNDRSYAIAPSTFGTVEQSHYTYIGFADSESGDGFTTAYSESKLFYAVKVSATALTPLYTDFSGLWMPFEKHRDDKYATYSNHKLVEATGNVGMYNSLNFGQNACTPVAYHYKGTYNRIYFVLYDCTTDANGDNRASNTTGSYVMYYDLDTGSFSPPIALPQDYPASTDYHDLPAMTVTDTGFIIIAKEELDVGGGNHNSPMEIYRSQAAETIEDPASPGTHYFTEVLELAIGTYDYAYPKFQKSSTPGEIMLFMRGYSGGGDLHNALVIRTQDNGLTWESLAGVSNTVTRIAECEDISGTNLNWYFYNHLAKGPEKTYGFHFFGFLNEGPHSGGRVSPDGTNASNTVKYIVYMQSDDGITWNNIVRYITGSGGFSKNVVSSGAVTAAELLANCVAGDVSTDAHESYMAADVWIDKDGIPYILTPKWYRYLNEATDYSLKGNVLKGYYVIYYNTTTPAWTSIDITSLLVDSIQNPYSSASEMDFYAIRPTMVVYGDGVFDVILNRVIDSDGMDNYKLLDSFHPAFSAIDDIADLVVGQTYRIISTETNNFYDGCAVGDYYRHSGTPTLSPGSNTLVPVIMETVFWRTTDNGTTWFQVREPYRSPWGDAAIPNPPMAGSSNMHDSGYNAIFVGRGRKASYAGTAIDHSAFTMFIDKVQV